MTKEKLIVCQSSSPLGKKISDRAGKRSLMGFTLSELMVALAISTIVIFGISVILLDGQRSWQAMYNRIYSDVRSDSCVAKKAFDAVIRKASSSEFLLGQDSSWIEVYYYEDANSTAVDRYARFYMADGQLNLEHGRLTPNEVLTTQTICENVSNCVFKQAGRSAQMILTLDNGSQTVSVVSSAVMHN